MKKKYNILKIISFIFSIQFSLSCSLLASIGALRMQGCLISAGWRWVFGPCKRPMKIPLFLRELGCLAAAADVSFIYTAEKCLITTGQGWKSRLCAWPPLTPLRRKGGQGEEILLITACESTHLGFLLDFADEFMHGSSEFSEVFGWSRVII